MRSRASCRDGSINCPTIAKKGQTPVTASRMPPWAPLASFSPNRRRFWSINAISNKPRDKIMLGPCLAFRRFPVTIRYNWLQVLGTTETPQIDQGVGHQFHPVVALLDGLETEEQPLEFVLPR